MDYMQDLLPYLRGLQIYFQRIESQFPTCEAPSTAWHATSQHSTPRHSMGHVTAKHASEPKMQEEDGGVEEKRPQRAD